MMESKQGVVLALRDELPMSAIVQGRDESWVRSSAT